jgi:hypothetical protein
MIISESRTYQVDVPEGLAIEIEWMEIECR